MSFLTQRWHLLCSKRIKWVIFYSHFVFFFFLFFVTFVCFTHSFSCEELLKWTENSLRMRAKVDIIVCHYFIIRKYTTQLTTPETSIECLDQRPTYLSFLILFTAPYCRYAISISNALPLELKSANSVGTDIALCWTIWTMCVRWVGIPTERLADLTFSFQIFQK